MFCSDAQRQEHLVQQVQTKQYQKHQKHQKPRIDEGVQFEQVLEIADNHLARQLALPVDTYAESDRYFSMLADLALDIQLQANLETDRVDLASNSFIRRLSNRKESYMMGLQMDADDAGPINSLESVNMRDTTMTVRDTTTTSTCHGVREWCQRTCQETSTARDDSSIQWPVLVDGVGLTTVASSNGEILGRLLARDGIQEFGHILGRMLQVSVHAEQVLALCLVESPQDGTGQTTLLGSDDDSDGVAIRLESLDRFHRSITAIIIHNDHLHLLPRRLPVGECCKDLLRQQWNIRGLLVRWYNDGELRCRRGGWRGLGFASLGHCMGGRGAGGGGSS